MLSDRQRIILKTLVSDYIATAVPVGSEGMLQKYRLGFSSATIRNEMAVLEKEGYIIRPHTSAGGMPSDRGYRYYVQYLTEPEQLPVDEQHLMRQLFFRVEKELEEWLNLTASMLARLVHSVSFVTPPRGAKSQFKHLELVAVHDYLALLVLVLDEARVRQQLITFKETLTQEKLSAVSGKLNALYSGKNQSEIAAKASTSVSGEESAMDIEVTLEVVRVMQGEDQTDLEEPHLEGLLQLVKQPEFARREEMLGLVQILEEKRLLQNMLSRMRAEEDVRVIIGGENADQAMRSYSVIFSRYGVPGKGEGTVGVLGPTRLPYGRAISSVRYMSSLLSEMVSHLYEGSQNPQTSDSDNVNHGG